MADTLEPKGSRFPVRAVDAPIRLQVGERQFTTTTDTLTGESGFFASLLSGRWDNALDDGSYFIDADPTLFEHILCYLRRGVFPLFFDMAKGHDYHLYLSLLQEARYFQIPRLQDWLEKKRYFEAVKVTTIVEEHDEDHASRWEFSVLPAGTMLEYHPRWTTKMVYICPRGIPEHKGVQEACGRRCRSARGENDVRFEEVPTVRMLVIKREVALMPDVCMARDGQTETVP